MNATTLSYETPKSIVKFDGSLRQRTAKPQTISQKNAETTSTLQLPQLLQDVVDLTKKRFGLYHAHIYLMDEAGENLVLASGAGEVGRSMVASGHTIPYNYEDSLIATAARNRRAVVADNVLKNPRYIPHPLLPDTRSEMAIPMIANNRLIGVLDVQADILYRFSDEDVRIKTTLAAQIAAAVDESFTPDMHEDRSCSYGGHHLLNILNDILDLGRIEAGTLLLDPQPIELVSFAQDVVRAGQVLVKHAPIELGLFEAQTLPLVYADPVRLRQIIWNLMSNAVKFTNSGMVTVTLGIYDAQNVYVEIADTGVGIKQSDLPKLFEPFRTIGGSAARRAGGSGLGLNITRHLVEMHGGMIDVMSEVGVGSVFRFTMPAYLSEKI